MIDDREWETSTRDTRTFTRIKTKFYERTSNRESVKAEILFRCIYIYSSICVYVRDGLV